MAVELPFRPGDVSWDVLHEPIYLIGGMRAVLLQLAEPRVAAGVAEHSNYRRDLYGRLRRTLDLMAIIGLGDAADAADGLAEMHRAHRSVRGTMPDGTAYDARDPDLRLWVMATLIDTVLTVEERYIGEFDESARRRYYEESRAVCEVFGVHDSPPDLAGFRTYMADAGARLRVTPEARAIGYAVLHPPVPLMPDRLLAPLRTITADLLDEHLRGQYGLELTARQARRVRRLQHVSRRVLPALPRWVRTFPVLHPVAGLRYRLAAGTLAPRPGLGRYS